MTEDPTMPDHFAHVAPVYREMRTTDEEPILYIRDVLEQGEGLRGADIGCGAGRYDLLLLRHLPGLRLTCVDASPAMLAQLRDLVSGAGYGDVETIVATAEDMTLPAGAFDFVCSFNAVHHFDFPAFLEKAADGLRPGGRLFIYTRTPRQNAGSVWGKHFPDFCVMETRLYRRELMQTWIEAADRLELTAVKVFRFERRAPLARLLAQVRSKHYSTFYLYAPEAFDKACKTFEKNIRRAFPDPDRVKWRDQNILLAARRR